MLIDTHCHLDAAEYDADRDVVVQQAHAAGVRQIVIPAVERANFAVVSDTCRRYSGCFPAYGIHPLFVGRAAESDLEVLRNVLSDTTVVAVGEIGLDFYVQDHDIALQEYYFVEQLKIARDYDLPVILHVRRAVDAILKHLRRIKVRGGIAHAFNGSYPQAETFMALGFKLGFGGAMTYDRALRIRALARVLPLEAIVLETDAPDMPPAWLGQRGRNSPAELPRIAQVLAELRGEQLDHIAAATSHNALTVFPSIANGR
jgi:TatD DNase family protein